MAIKKSFYAKTKDGEQVDLFTITNSKGGEVKIVNFGGTVVSLKVPDKAGNFEDVVLGYDDLDSYINNECYFGALIGRNSNRIENAEFTMNGKVYKIAQNSGKHQLHGGFKGFDRVIWEAEIIEKNGEEVLSLKYTSKDGEEGFPGEVKVQVIYSLGEDNSLGLDYSAVSDKDTVVNLTNHSYFNLAGHASGDILSHELMIKADQFTEVDNECIPTGVVLDVQGTPFDFRNFNWIGAGLEVGHQQLDMGGGYDHNFVLKVSGIAPEKIAEVYEPKSGRVMEVLTTKPGVQLYTGNFITPGTKGKNGAIYNKRSGLCLETQYFPNNLKYKHFKSSILKAGEKYHHITIYKFTTR